MARRVNQIQNITFTAQLIIHPSRGELDRNSPLSFQIHRIQKLAFHFALGNRPGNFQKPIGQGGFPVINMGDDAKISYIF